MIKRSPTHVIDTLAFRTLLNHMPDDWLVRGLEERDYGIDLTIELFSGSEPTGQFALIQLKGRKKKFESRVVFDVPVKTIKYALLFQQPFFLFHTSIEDKETYFVWIQKYVKLKLDKENPKWRKKEDDKKVRFEFPSENTLSENPSKIEEIMCAYASRTSGIEFLASYEWFSRHWNSGSYKDVMIDACLTDVSKMKNCIPFLNYYANASRCPNPPCFSDLENELTYFKNALKDNAGDEELLEYSRDIEVQRSRLADLKEMFLQHDEVDKYLSDEFALTPY